MANNRGKEFENVIRECFNKVPDTNVIRLPDPVQGYLGVRNHCDFIVYHYPYEYHIECKSVHGNRLPLSNITDNQWNGLLEVSKIKGIVAGVICWWVDKDTTLFLPIGLLQCMKDLNEKSIRYDFYNRFNDFDKVIGISGRKKRVYFDYDMESFFKHFNPVATR